MFKNSIWAGPAGVFRGPSTQEAVVATGVFGLRPGHLVKLDSNGEVIFASSSQAAGDDGFYTGYVVNVKPITQGGTLDQVFVSGELVELIKPRSGELVNVLFNNGDDAAIGAPISVGFDGFAASSVDNVLFRADENNDEAAVRLVRVQKI